MESILGIFLSTLFSLVNSYQQLTPLTPTTAEMFPYHAVIEANANWANGVIISEKFVLTIASIVVDKTDCTVYLGFSRYPRLPENRKDPNGQIFQVEQVYIHEDFGYLEPTKHELNNFALLKLGKDIVLSKTVRPIPIASPDDFPVPPGTFINRTGFLQYENGDYDIRHATVQEKNLELCNVFYGNSFIPSQEGCVVKTGEKLKAFIGPYVVDGKLIGVQRSFESTCYIDSPPCDGKDVYMSLEPSLLWIFRISGVAGVNGRKLFKEDNPFWKPEISQLVPNLVY